MRVNLDGLVIIRKSRLGIAGRHQRIAPIVVGQSHAGIKLDTSRKIAYRRPQLLLVGARKASSQIRRCKIRADFYRDTELSDRLVESLLLVEHGAEIVMCFRVPVIDFDGSGGVRPSPLHVALSKPGYRAIYVGLSKSRVQGQAPVEVGNGAVQVPLFAFGSAAIDVSSRHSRANGDGPAIVGDGGVKVLFGCQKIAAVEECPGGARLDLDRFVKIGCRATQIANRLPGKPAAVIGIG